MHLNFPYSSLDWVCLLGSYCSMQSAETIPRARLQVCYSAPTLFHLHFRHQENCGIGPYACPSSLPFIKIQVTGIFSCLKPE